MEVSLWSLLNITSAVCNLIHDWFFSFAEKSLCCLKRRSLVGKSLPQCTILRPQSAQTVDVASWPISDHFKAKFYRCLLSLAVATCVMCDTRTKGLVPKNPGSSVFCAPEPNILSLLFFSGSNGSLLLPESLLFRAMIILCPLITLKFCRVSKIERL